MLEVFRGYLIEKQFGLTFFMNPVPSKPCNEFGSKTYKNQPI